jgi:phosphoribosyl-AMP cyclohydrolase
MIRTSSPSLVLKRNHSIPGMSPLFSPRRSVEQVEEGTELAPKFDEHGLIPCITQHETTGEVLMFAYMNEEALRLTLATGFAHYWSRSRGKLWRKGETSGMRQRVVRPLIDDDQDCVILRVTLEAPAAGGDEASCHVGYRSCFFGRSKPPATGQPPCASSNPKKPSTRSPSTATPRIRRVSDQGHDR